MMTRTGRSEYAANLTPGPSIHSPLVQRTVFLLGVPDNVGVFSQGQRAFLEYHRNSVLLQRRR
jgi:hypothetical protein